MRWEYREYMIFILLYWLLLHFQLLFLEHFVVRPTRSLMLPPPMRWCMPTIMLLFIVVQCFPSPSTMETLYMSGRCPVRRLRASESSLSNVVGQPSSPILLDMFFLGAIQRSVLGWVHFLHQSFGNSNFSFFQRLLELRLIVLIVIYWEKRRCKRENESTRRHIPWQAKWFHLGCFLSFAGFSSILSSEHHPPTWGARRWRGCWASGHRNNWGRWKCRASSAHQAELATSMESCTGSDHWCHYTGFSSGTFTELQEGLVCHGVTPVFSTLFWFDWRSDSKRWHEMARVIQTEMVLGSLARLCETFCFLCVPGRMREKNKPAAIFPAKKRINKHRQQLWLHSHLTDSGSRTLLATGDLNDSCETLEKKLRNALTGRDQTNVEDSTCFTSPIRRLIGMTGL